MVKIKKCKTPRPKMHRRGNAKVKIITETHIPHYTDTKARIPIIHIAGYGACQPILQNLLPHIGKLCIHQIHTKTNTKMKRSQVYIRLVLHLAHLCRRHQCHKGHYNC